MLRTTSTRVLDEHLGASLRYCVVGLSGYLLSMGVFAAQVEAGVSPYAALPAGFVANGAWNFVLNRLWAFPGSTGSWRGDFGRFAVVAGVSLACNYIAFFLLHGVAGVAAVPSQALAILVVIPVGYLGQRYWAFGAR